MSIETDSELELNETEYDYDIYGDTRNNKKHNEEKHYGKYSYNYINYKKIYNSMLKKEKQREKYNQMKQNDQIEKKEMEDKKELEKNKKILEHHLKTRIIPFNKNGINLKYYHKINKLNISSKMKDELINREIKKKNEEISNLICYN